MDAKFVKDVLAGRKALMKVKNVIFVKNVPHWEKLTASYIWNEVKGDSAITRYFKDYQLTLPSR